MNANPTDHAIRQPDAQHRGVFSVDPDRALDALRLAWGEAYAICFDDLISAGGDRWQAWRLDGSRTRIAGSTPDELNRAIRADWAREDAP
jgi:hypothetical protein